MAGRLKVVQLGTCSTMYCCILWAAKSHAQAALTYNSSISWSSLTFHGSTCSAL